MYLSLVAIAWIYVVLLMAMTESSIIAGVMTFLLYCVFPLTVILYVMGTPQRKRRRLAEEKSRRAEQLTPDDSTPPSSDLPTQR